MGSSNSKKSSKNKPTTIDNSASTVPIYQRNSTQNPSTSSNTYNQFPQPAVIKKPKPQISNRLSNDWAYANDVQDEWVNLNVDKSKYVAAQQRFTRSEELTCQPSSIDHKLLKNSNITIPSEKPTLNEVPVHNKVKINEFHQEKTTEIEKKTVHNQQRSNRRAVNHAGKTLKTQNKNWIKETSQTQRLNPMPIEKLADIVSTNEPRVITFILNNHSMGFIDLLKQNDMPADSLKLILKAIQIFSECSECPFTRSALLQTILYCDIFYTSLPQWLTEIDVNSLSLVFNILSICNKLMLEFPRESARKLKATLQSAKVGLQNLDRQDAIANSCLEMIEDLLQSSHKICSSSDNLVDVVKTENQYPDTETSNICSVHVMMIEKELSKILENKEENDYDYAKMLVKIVGIDFNSFNGLQHLIQITEIETKKGRVLLPGSLIALHPHEDNSNGNYLRAVVTETQLECGTLLIKFSDLDSIILNSTTTFVLIEGPILYKVEYITLLEALNLTCRSEIGLFEQLKPTEKNQISKEKISIQINKNLTNFDDNGVKTVFTCPGENGIKFGIQYINKKLFDKPVKPILVLCKTDNYLITFVQELIDTTQKIICSAGTENVNINNLSKWTLNQQQKYWFHNDFAHPIRKQIIDKMNRLKQEIINELETLNTNCQSIASADCLTQFMTQKQKSYFESGNTIDNWLNLSLRRMPQIIVNDKSDIKCETKYIFNKQVDERLSQLELNRRISEFDNSKFIDNKNYWAQSKGKLDEQQSLRNLQLFATNDFTTASINEQLQKSLPLKLNDNERWQLYDFWLQSYKQTKLDRIKSLCVKYEKMFKQLEEIVREIHLSTIRSSEVEVVVMTTVAAIKQHSLLKLCAFNTVLVMEAADVPEAHILPFIPKSCQSLIIVGNSLFHQPYLSGVQIFDSTNLQQINSILEQGLRSGVNVYVAPCATEMHPFTHQYFTTMNWLQCSTNSIANSKTIKGMNWSIAILDHNQTDLLTENNYINPYEEKVIMGLCKAIIKKGTPDTNITIITLSTDQWISTTNLIIKLQLNIKCEMITNLKNEKNDIIVLSASPLNDRIYSKKYISQLLAMVNVGFVCVAKFKILNFKKNNNMWEKLVCCAEANGLVGKTGAILCQNEHKSEELTFGTTNINKLAKAIASGCKKLSTIRLSCGHTCLEKCALIQQHQNIQCKEKCLKVVCKEHKTVCKNVCGDECSLCLNHKCKKKLSCGHICSKMANELCEINCSEPVDYVGSPCGHQFQIRCYEKVKSPMYLSMKCETKCDAIKSCGHKCDGNCGKCFGGKMHIPCLQKCQKTLVCGHLCDKQCEVECPPCNKVMSHTCSHKGKISYLCGTLIPVCIEKCSKSCPHFSCLKQCWEPCDFFPCKEPCQKLLSCGHQCIGLCNDNCPIYCVKCHPSVFTLCQHSSSMKYVYLEDCGHMIDVNLMDNIMKQTISFYSCPICGVLIENCKRYKNALIQQQCNLFSIRSTYERGGQAHLLADIADDEQLPNENLIVKAPNKKFDLARQQIILELYTITKNINSNKVIKSKITYFNTIVNLFQTSVSTLCVNKTDNLRLIKDYINKLLVMHRVLNSNSSQRQLNDFHCELQRTIILAHVLGLELITNSPSHVISCFILKQLQEQKPFTAEILAKIISCMKDVDRMANAKNPFQSAIDSFPLLTQLLSMINGRWEQCGLKFWHFKDYEKCTTCLS